MGRGPFRRYLGRLLVLVLLVAVAATLWGTRALDSRPEGNPAEVTVEVPRGIGGRDLVERLHGAGLAPRPDLLYWTLRLSETFPVIQAGTHVLPGDATVLELVDLLRRPARIEQVVLTLIPGESVWQAAARFEAAGLATRRQLLEMAGDRALVSSLGLPVGPLRPPRPDRASPTYLEGFLYPETHHFRPDASPADVLKRVTETFLENWRELGTRRRADRMVIYQRYGLDDHGLVVLASLVEEETSVASEAPRIAGVFYNRLDQGMPLQTDPTLMYHPDRVGGVPTPADRRDPSNPYNTYVIGGLPPGPICSPGRAALEAVVAPERHDLLYFVARRDGRGGHAFSRTYAGHLRNIRTHLRGQAPDTLDDPSPEPPPGP